MPRSASTTGRGYGWEHQQRRARWAPKVAAGGVACARCGEFIAPGAPWDLGHDDSDPSKRTYSGPEHANHCNRSAGARKGNMLRRVRKAAKQVTSLRW